MSFYNVREAFQLLKERGIARDKQEIRKWLQQGFIRADPPVNRRVGWKIHPDALQAFIQQYERGEYDGIIRRRRRSSDSPTGRSPSGSLIPASGEERSALDPYLLMLEAEVLSLKEQLREQRQELNDLKKILGFPILRTSDEQK